VNSLRIEKVLCHSAPFAHAHNVPLIAAGAQFSLGSTRGAGKFGSVCGAEPDLPEPNEAELVAKVFHPEAVAEVEEDVLVERVVRLQAALEPRPETDWPDRILGLPFALATTEVDGQRRLVAFMLDLQDLGYETVDLYDHRSADLHRRRPLHERVEFAIHFTRGYRLLEEIGFLHGDLNPENLMFNPASLDVQIIDLDAGVVLERGDETPLVAGKPGDCMPPEIKQTTPGLPPVDIKKYTAGAERWSTGSLVGLILYGLHPGFFLRAISSPAIEAYAGQGPWPAIEEDSPEFTSHPPNRQAYEQIKPAFEAAPGECREAFARFFSAGIDGMQRPSARDWTRALSAARRPPSFKFLTAEPPVAPEGTEVVLSWATEDADRVESPVLGVLPANGTATILADQTRRHALTAINFYGETEQATDVVRVVPLPRIDSIPLSGFPGLNLKTTFSTPNPKLPLQLPAPRLTRSLGRPPALPSPLRATTRPRIHLPSQILRKGEK
jgi:serine/threonine protein kinase